MTFHLAALLTTTVCLAFTAVMLGVLIREQKKLIGYQASYIASLRRLNDAQSAAMKVRDDTIQCLASRKDEGASDHP